MELQLFPKLSELIVAVQHPVGSLAQLATVADEVVLLLEDQPV